MPREDAELSPLAVSFADLFDHIGTLDIRYSDEARALSGRAVVIEGYLSRAHGPHSTVSLVDQPGLCPDCSPVPAAVIALPGVHAPMQEGDGAVRVAGRLDYGLRIADGVASLLRIESATLLPL
jgi:hypothetical protein